MPVNTQAIGKTYEPTLYAVGREKIREYARAVGETNPLYLDVEAARAAGYADVVAPPMFAVVYSAPLGRAGAVRPRRRDRLREDGARRPGVRVGRRSSSPATRSPRPRRVKDISERDGRGFYVFEIDLDATSAASSVCTRHVDEHRRGV